MSRKSPFGFLFGKNLENLISGIRRRQDADEQDAYVREVIAECREEVRSADYDVKTMAVLKLAYLEMRGYDMTWAGFHVIEVMASPAFQQKRIGYIAAMQSFRGDSELLMLVTNLLKMDLVNKNVATVGIALSGLATIVTPLLAQDVADDIVRMLAHSNARIRQKAVLALHKVVLQYPEVFPVAVQRIGDLIEAARASGSTEDVSVLCAAVSVVGELAYHAENLDLLIELTPTLYDVFLASQNNWTLLKLLKIFQLFAARAPRLRTRLLPALRDTLSTAVAPSVVYEVIRCIVHGGMLQPADYDLAQELLRRTLALVDETEALQDWAAADANLRFVVLGLLVKLAEINAQFVPSKLVSAVLKAPHADPATLKRVFALALAAVNDDNLYEIVEDLVAQCNRNSAPGVKLDIIRTVAAIGAVRNYAHVPDFRWYVAILSEFCAHVYADCLSARLLDIAIRVHDAEVQEAVANACFNWIAAEPARGVASGDEVSLNSRAEFERMASTFWWIVGEYPTQLMLDSLPTLVELAAAAPPSPNVVSTVVKLAAKHVARAQYVDEPLLKKIVAFLEPLTLSIDFEVQERACEAAEVFKLAQNQPDKAVAILGSELRALFSAYSLQPVAAGSQRRIHPPTGLDLETPLAQLHADSDDEADDSVEPEETLVAVGAPELEPEPQPELEEDESLSARRELFDLSATPDLTSSLFAVPDPTPKPKLVKKKVHVAQDETIESEPYIPEQSKGSQLFNVQIKTPLAPIDEPVKVKHKKRRRKRSVGAATAPGGSSEPVSAPPAEAQSVTSGLDAASVYSDASTVASAAITSQDTEPV